MSNFLNEFPVITTERLVLRNAQERDAKDLYDEFTNPNVTRYLDWGGPDSVEQALECIHEWEQEFRKKNFINWAITESNNDILVGTVVINTRDRNPQYGLFTHKITEVISLGYNLKEDYWGKGYATEAVRGVLEFIFENMNTPRVEACVDPQNRSSIKVLTKLLFTKEGLLRKYWYNSKTKQHDDMVMMSLLADEYDKRKSGR
jgi:ribosomal-protein-alanine N-acetyltransferase